MKKVFIPAVIALSLMNVSAKGKWDAPYRDTMLESNGLTKELVCEKKECVETITIPESFKEKVLNIKPDIFANEHDVSMPGDTRTFNLKIINLSKNNFTYQDKSLYLKPIEDKESYTDILSYNNAQIPVFSTMYRLYNSEPLKFLYDGKDLTDEQIKDENIEKKLQELGYAGISELDKYYLDYFNKNYKTNFKSLDDLTQKYINKIWTDISRNSEIPETNKNLIEFHHNYFYNILLTMKYNDKKDMDNNIYSVGAYSRNEESYQNLNTALNSITIPATSETSFEPFYFHLNGPLTRNSFTLFTYGIDVGLSFDKKIKYGKIKTYYIDSLGNLLTDIITMEDEVDNPYETEEKSFSGYKLIRVDGPKSGTFQEKVQEVYYMYDWDNETPVDNIIPNDDLYTGVTDSNWTLYSLIVSFIFLIGAKIKYARK